MWSNLVMNVRVLIEFCCKICNPYQNRSPKISKKGRTSVSQKWLKFNHNLNDHNQIWEWSNHVTKEKMKKNQLPIYQLDNQNQIWLWIPISWSNLVVSWLDLIKTIRCGTTFDHDHSFNYLDGIWPRKHPKMGYHFCN